MKPPILVLASLSLSVAVGAQSPPPAARSTAEIVAAAPAADWRSLDPENTVYLELASGRVVLELAPAFAPRHVANVKALAREGYFDGLAIMRVQDNYVVQWGDADNTKAVQKAEKHLRAEFSIAAPKDLPFTALPDGDGYAPQVGFSSGMPLARDPRTGQVWLAHCYSMLGAGRDNDADSGGGTELYVVIGHAPRHLDRNVTLFGRVVKGIELLSSLPRGGGNQGNFLGFYTKEQRVPIRAMRVAADVPESQRSAVQVMRTDTATFAAVVESRRNRRDPWTKVPAGHVELCNVPLPVRDAPAGPKAGTP